MLVYCTSLHFSNDDLIFLALHGKTVAHISLTKQEAKLQRDKFVERLKEENIQYTIKEYEIQVFEKGFIRFLSNEEVLLGGALKRISRKEIEDP